MTTRTRVVWAMVAALAGMSAASAQQVLIDQGRRAAGLWCFPTVANPREWVYIPEQARLGTDDAGGPQFSFVQYVSAKEDNPDTGATITSAAGGGILHFLVLYETPPETVAEAQKALREALQDEELVVRGPIVFSDGRYALVSSILNPDTGQKEPNLLATGRAPVLEGNKLALSFDLDAKRATLLMKSFTMATPDVSLVFDMTFSGLTEAYDAELSIDWSEVRKHQGFKGGINVYFISADVELMFDEMRRDNAIRLRSSGSDSAMEALLEVVYNKLLELMFRPVEPEKLPETEQGGLLSGITSALGGGAKSKFGLHVGYQLKELKSTGISVLNFNHRSTVERHGFITFNIGDIYAKHGQDERYFRAFNLEDPVYQQREVHVALDGALVGDFERYINSVTVTLRKVHQSGAETLREVVLDRKSFDQPPDAMKMVYGWDEDADRSAWLRYDYRTRWSFKGGGTYQTDWTVTDAPMIDVFAPYELRTVQLIGDIAALEEREVRAVMVQISYPFFDRPRKVQLVVKPGEIAEEKTAEVTLPEGVFEYDYTITWHTKTGRVSTSGKDSSGVVFIDEMPEQ